MMALVEDIQEGIQPAKESLSFVTREGWLEILTNIFENVMYVNATSMIIEPIQGY